MNCLDARRLLQQGDRAPEAGRDDALEHLDGCAECGAVAAGLDPLLLFRRLPELAIAAGETARMRDAVAVLRRSSSEPAPPRAAAVGLRLAAAIVAAGGLWLTPGPIGREGSTPVAEARLAGAIPLPEYMPTVETIGGTDAYVATQVTEDDLTLVILANVDVAGR